MNNEVIVSSEYYDLIKFSILFDKPDNIIATKSYIDYIESIYIKAVETNDNVMLLRLNKDFKKYLNKIRVNKIK